MNLVILIIIIFFIIDLLNLKVYKSIYNFFFKNKLFDLKIYFKKYNFYLILKIRVNTSECIKAKSPDSREKYC
jgi:hypothetical protein